jgi:hypothetical protein
MTIDADAAAAAPHQPQQEEIVRFVFRAASTAGLLQRARAMLAAAPAELSESFEQAVRTSEFAS